MGANEQGANATANRWLTIPRTLCFVFNGEDVLLMKRAPNRRVFANRYNGVGGHIEHNEDPYSSAKREILEETGLNVNELRLRAVYNIDAGEATGIMLFLFTCTSQVRDVQANPAEGTLHWIPLEEILNLDLVDDLPIILPRIINMKADAQPLFVHASYDSQDQLVMTFAEQ
jgi:8-oxo-dGTP diphosphatase